MFAIAAAVLFAIALLLQLVNQATTFGAEVCLTIGLLALALQLAGFSERIPARGGWRSRSSWGRRR
ncbi:hypothetical protein OHB26_33240 [Nocardia sp. NBC_01503]|uniref:hypothetical protein n=1 Tax=Nocardia sp. NBC_01503 TaxID=2975997 RepID=UPI002E7B5D1B|nr:hypothetical protein [Nocardia sp. NBC_01503]WTL31719.1 hypothetical protein OHB26_33240 [Nocardia sp. NBC_01503]